MSDTSLFDCPNALSAFSSIENSLLSSCLCNDSTMLSSVTIVLILFSSLFAKVPYYSRCYAYHKERTQPNRQIFFHCIICLLINQSRFFLIIFEVIFVDELLLCDVDLALTLSFSLSSTLLPCTSNLCVLTPIGVQVINVQ